MGKGEIARYEQFLLFPQCFQKACFPGVSKGVIVWQWVIAEHIENIILKGNRLQRAIFPLPFASVSKGNCLDIRLLGERFTQLSRLLANLSI